ncbi:class I mannose-6-phosphate isomerase [Halomonas sp. WWR20]
MDWYPLSLTTPTRSHIFGGTLIQQHLGRTGLSQARIAETWEVSDVDGDIAQVAEGPLAGSRLRDLAMSHPDALVGPGWRGPHFPLLTKFIDATGMLPVHLHADDETAQRLEQQPNGKTEAWHILEAKPGATALVGLQPGVDKETLRDALWRENYDSVMRRLPVRAGETIYVPGGTLHSFGPDTLIYEIEQTSDIQQHAMPWNMEDGSPVPPEERRANIDKLLEELKPESRPDFRPGLRIQVKEGIDRLICCAGPYFALERWRVDADVPLHYGFERAVVLSNVGQPVTVCAGAWRGELGRAKSLLLPAALGEVEIKGPADLLIGYVPELEKDIRAPLEAAGYSAELIASLGEGFAG